MDERFVMNETFRPIICNDKIMSSTSFSSTAPRRAAIRTSKKKMKPKMKRYLSECATCLYNNSIKWDSGNILNWLKNVAASQWISLITSKISIKNARVLSNFMEFENVYFIKKSV